MRSIKDINKYKYLGKWIRIDDWVNTYKCIGESDEKIYLWHGSICSFYKSSGREVIIGDINTSNDSDYHSYIDMDISVLSNNDKIKWIK